VALLLAQGRATGIGDTFTGTQTCYRYRWDFYWHTDVSTGIDGTVTGTREQFWPDALPAATSDA